ncbi:hypothetical protein BVRB_3g067440 [Beta vulgaris subsp. vulgaris]|uniref:Peptidase M48 domain-containing protein n=1 Tax=Beta vulgaris subsp. vulgaris TaxID=3555 RepID=A0A0J8BG22_BETVV|nr:hypothetical protein BVRB_3g067440 [Beta vulgaris subsp. vulgaris]
MAWYRRSRFVYNAYKSLNSKLLLPKSPVPSPVPRINSNSSSLFYNQFKSSIISGSPSISSKFGYLNGVKQNQSSLFSCVTRRNYHVDTNQIYLFLERRYGEFRFEKRKEDFKGKILPAIHPDSVRVRLISKDIIESLGRGISHERAWSTKALTEGMDEKVPRDWHKEEEVLDDKWVKDSRKKGEKHGAKTTTNHLEGLNWEVLVVNEPFVNASYFPGGKIVVFTGLLKHLKSDAELATIIGHEVGHAVARHSAERITWIMSFASLQLILLIALDFAYARYLQISSYVGVLLILSFDRKGEIEADYIGLLLMASAGYDPRIAPQVYEKLGKISGESSSLKEYLSTHPSGKKRAQLLARAHIMKEAVDIYREIVAGHAIEGFL